MSDLRIFVYFHFSTNKLETDAWHLEKFTIMTDGDLHYVCSKKPYIQIDEGAQEITKSCFWVEIS